MVVTSPEDADYLTAGVMEVLPRRFSHLACFWTERHRFEAHPDLATVSHSFIDPTTPERIDSVIVVRSIIDSGCVVRAELEQLLMRSRPRQVVISAPVMRKGADDALRSELAPALANRFHFVRFATESTVIEEDVVPGVGGEVYERLGFPRMSQQRIMPALVKCWRASKLTRDDKGVTRPLRRLD